MSLQSTSASGFAGTYEVIEGAPQGQRQLVRCDHGRHRRSLRLLPRYPAPLSGLLEP